MVLHDLYVEWCIKAICEIFQHFKKRTSDQRNDAFEVLEISYNFPFGARLTVSETNLKSVVFASAPPLLLPCTWPCTRPRLKPTTRRGEVGNK